MGLSGLQKSILKACLAAGGRSSRGSFSDFYRSSKKPPSPTDQVHSITKALERLIDREFLIGYGVRTTHKWYIREVKLTVKGRKLGKELLGKQQHLPLRARN